MNCRICNTILPNISLTIKEKMYGTNQSFEYFLCSNCNCIQISNIPINLSEFYPKDYYSFNNNKKLSYKKKVKKVLYFILSLLKGKYYEAPTFNSLGISFLERNKDILDIGCGNGQLINEMRFWGFSSLTGIDPYVEKEYVRKHISIYKKTINQLTGKYDIIISRHSLEHMPDPHIFFSNIPNLLKPGGRLLLGIPIYPNYIWDKYGTDWIQLDAPRHLYTFSLFTIQYLCKKYNLVIDKVTFDGQPWALASTQYCLNGGTHIEFAKQILISDYHIKECNNANEKCNGDSVFITIKLCTI